ncbi:MAG TPA: glycosyltransferase [Longimicrobium sp.]|jgi:glycosyltransferase involved in cell wall biosynthesis|uniref:glycosyltransferase n=1 Tax=Longimicrobium sp. TaxID=2029185 RepID=UPI002EDAFCB5
MKLVIHVDGPVIRGNERQLLFIARWMLGRGHDVAVACRDETEVGEAFRALGARTTPHRPRGDGDLWHQLRFAAWLRRERPNALLLASWKRFPAAASAARLAGVPRVILRVGLPQPLPRTGPGAWKYRTAFRWIHGVIANATGLRDYFAGQVPALADRMYVVRNATEASTVAPGGLRAEIGAAPGERILLSVGALEKRKGYDLLIDAFGQVGPGVHLVLAGDGPLRDELRARADAGGVGGRVHLLGHRRDASALMAAADAFVLPSRADGMANVILEAMAASLPVVAFDVHGAHDCLAALQGRPPAGWIVPGGTADALGAALAELVRDLRAGGPEPAARGAEGRWRVENWFTLEQMGPEYERILFGAEGG